ncbi:MAG: hypothetical protein E7Z91_02650 [Cyanobacteria bacterium SIG30]|nr:hypothetical protein [Cyanobacteria bacterium SIG30]
MYKKIFWLVLIVCATFLITGCGKNYKSSYDFYKQMQIKKMSLENIQFKINSDIDGIGMQIDVKKAGDKLRLENTLKGNKNKTIYIRNNEGSYAYTSSSNKAYETNQNVELQLNILEWQDANETSMEFGKRKKINGEKCLELFNKSEWHKTYYCISEKYGIPIKSVLTTKINNIVFKTSMEISNIKTSKPSKSNFELPKDLKVIRLSK